MKSSAIGLSCFSLLLATITLARAATSFETLRLVSAVDPTVAPWATPNGDSFGMQLAPDGAWVFGQGLRSHSGTHPYGFGITLQD